MNNPIAFDNAPICPFCKSKNTEWYPAFRNGKEVGQVMCYDCGRVGWEASE